MTLVPDRVDPDYHLVWPAALLRAELAEVLDDRRFPLADGLELLLEEAFAGRQPREDLAEVVPATDPWDTSDAARRPAVLVSWAKGLLDEVDMLPTHRPRRYWDERQRPPSQDRPGNRDRDQDRLQLGWQGLMSGLVGSGYLDRAAGSDCPDTPGGSRDSRIRGLLSAQAGLGEHLWIGTEEPWRQLVDDDDFYTLVEVMHDLVARPRTTWYHPHCGQHHYEHFNRPTGQALYRWQVNDLFDRYQVGLRLAAEGEDAGLLVQDVHDPRRDLLEQTAVSVPDGNEGRVDHAVALYRGRHATPEDKRRACRELADVLESRKRMVLEQHLVKADESALFNIANNFAIRHHRDDQMYDYDPDFLDWIFWWYLATVELSNRLIARSNTP